ncbi:MAG: phosphatase [Alteromonadaceae bacterium]|nr:MAG: phosphatase [Alteromonadaceae bacterium]
MTVIYDLHCHSDQSDGILSPEALVSRAKSQNVEVLALTDHDTTNGLARAARQAEQENMRLIPGIEFSSQWGNMGVHIVGLNIDLKSSALLEAIDSQEKIRDERAIQIGQRLEAKGIKGALQGAKKQAGEGVICRPHFAHYMVEQGYVSSIEQAFKKYLGNGKAGDVKQFWPTFEQVIHWVSEASGCAVLAHPMKYKVTRTKLCAMVDAFKAAGGHAIEVVSGKQSQAHTNDLAKITNKYELLASCGSDFHRPGSEWQELGRHSQLPETVTPVWHDWG